MFSGTTEKYGWLVFVEKVLKKTQDLGGRKRQEIRENG
jgi:hypothetical protein